MAPEHPHARSLKKEPGDDRAFESAWSAASTGADVNATFPLLSLGSAAIHPQHKYGKSII
jgi:hypothetical protein